MTNTQTFEILEDEGIYESDERMVKDLRDITLASFACFEKIENLEKEDQ